MPKDQHPATFRVTGGFELPSRGLFVLAGDIRVGTITIGMVMDYPGVLHHRAVIAVESINYGAAGSQVGLCFEFDPHLADAWTVLTSDGPELVFTHPSNRADRD